MIVNDQKISTPEQLEKLVDKVLKGNADDRYIVVKGFIRTDVQKYMLLI